MHLRVNCKYRIYGLELSVTAELFQLGGERGQMNRKIAAATLAGASVLGLSVDAFAQSEETAEPIRLASVDEMTITATRNPSPAFSYPGSVTVIDKEKIDDLVATTVSDLFDAVPGLQFGGGPRRTGEAPSLRGVEGEGVVVLYDGVRQSFLSAHDGRFFIEPELLKSAEVVRGPGSALYGSGAVGGVLAFQTLDAADVLAEGESFGVRAKLGYQGVDDDKSIGGTAFARSQDGRVDGVVSVNYRNAGDIQLGSGEELQADDNVLSSLVKGSVAITEDLSVDASWLGYRGDAREPNNGQGANTGDIVNKDITSDTVRVGVDFNPSGNSWIDFGLIGYWNTSEVEEDEIDSDRLITREVETIGLVFDNRTRFELGEASELTFTYGAEYYEDDQVGLDNTTADGTRGGVPDASAETFGAFIQAEWTAETEFGDFRVIPAVRYDHFENSAVDETVNTDDGAVSPKIGVSYQPVDGLLIFGSYSEAFRAPSFNEIFADGVHFTIPLGPFVQAPNFFVPNPDLKPEESQTWEFGAGLDLDNLLADGDQFTLKGSYYTSDVDNLIDLFVDFSFSAPCFAPIPGPCTSGISQNVNTRRAELSGYEIEASYGSERFYADAAFSAIDGEDKDTGDFVGVLTAPRFNLDAGVKLHEIDARLGARAEIAGELDKVNSPADVRDSYEVFDLYFVWAPTTGNLEGLRLDLGIDNVADEDFERVFAGVSEAGRNFKVAMGWKYAF